MNQLSGQLEKEQRESAKCKQELEAKKRELCNRRISDLVEQRLRLSERWLSKSVLRLWVLCVRDCIGQAMQHMQSMRWRTKGRNTRLCFRSAANKPSMPSPPA